MESNSKDKNDVSMKLCEKSNKEDKANKIVLEDSIIKSFSEKDDDASMKLCEMLNKEDKADKTIVLEDFIIKRFGDIDVYFPKKIEISKEKKIYSKKGKIFCLCPFKYRMTIKTPLTEFVFDLDKSKFIKDKKKDCLYMTMNVPKELQPLANKMDPLKLGFINGLCYNIVKKFTEFEILFTTNK